MSNTARSSNIPQYFQTMSPVPPEPTSSKLPDPPAGPSTEREAEDSSAHATQDAKRALPEPRIRLELRDLRHTSTKVFLDNIDAATDVANLVETVIKLLYYPPSSPTSATPTTSSEDPQQPLRPHPYKPHIPGTRSVTLILRDMDGVAYTTGLDLDDDHKEIHFSLSYIASVASRFSPSATSASATTTGPGRSHDIRKELLGVICHELVHCYQWNALGTANGGLIEGVADFVRLRAGFVPPHWRREGGRRWDAGYQTTGYFLDWLEGKGGEGSVRRLNEAMREQEWDEARVWKEVYGEEVGALWREYCEKLKSEGVHVDEDGSGGESGSGSDSD